MSTSQSIGTLCRFNVLNLGFTMDVLHKSQRSALQSFPRPQCALRSSSARLGPERIVRAATRTQVCITRLLTVSVAWLP